MLTKTNKKTYVRVYTSSRRAKVSTGKAVPSRQKGTTKSTTVRKAPQGTVSAPLLAQSMVMIKTVNATAARQGLFRLMDEAAETHTPVLVTGRRSNAVLMAEEDYRSIQETLYLLSVPGLREELRAGQEESTASMPTRRSLKW